MGRRAARLGNLLTCTFATLCTHQAMPLVWMSTHCREIDQYKDLETCGLVLVLITKSKTVGGFTLYLHWAGRLNVQMVDTFIILLRPMNESSKNLYLKGYNLKSTFLELDFLFGTIRYTPLHPSHATWMRRGLRSSIESCNEWKWLDISKWEKLLWNETVGCVNQSLDFDINFLW